MWLLLDVDGCMWDLNNPDGTWSVYRRAVRRADWQWVCRETGRVVPEAEFHAFRDAHAPVVGSDRAILLFLEEETGRSYSIEDLASHRCGVDGYRPDLYLPPNPALVQCLASVAARGHAIAAVSDNPAARATIRAIGIPEEIIPEGLIFDPVRMGQFKREGAYFPDVLAILGIRAEDALVIGDSEHSDREPAEAAGIASRLAVGPDALIRVLTEVCSL